MLQKSEETEEELKASANKTPIDANPTADVASLETVLGNEYNFAMTQKPSSKEEAVKQIQLLDETSETIASKIAEEKRAANPDAKKIEKLEKQFEEIKTRKGIVEAAIPVAVNTTAEVTSLEKVLGSEYNFAMTQKPSSREEAAKQIQVLNELSESIESRIDEVHPLTTA